MRRWRLDSSSENRWIQGMLQISDIFQLVANITMSDRIHGEGLRVSYLRILCQAPWGLLISSAFGREGVAKIGLNVSRKKAGEDIEENIF